MKWNTLRITEPDGTVSLLSKPEWESFRSEEVIPALSELFVEGRLLADMISQKENITFDDLSLRFDDLSNRIRMVEGTMSHLSATQRERYPELKEIEEQVSQLSSSYYTDLGQHKGLYNAHVRFRDSQYYGTLSSAERHLIDESIKGFELAGVHLPEEDKVELKTLALRSAELATTFSNNVLTATDAWSRIITDESRLAGIPEDMKMLLKEGATMRGVSGFLITLKQPVVVSIFQYAEDRALREEVYYANTTRASELGEDQGKTDNTQIITDIVKTADREAHILAFQNVAEYYLERKMARDIGPDGVLRFLETLAVQAKRKAEVEWEAMCAFAKAELGLETVEAWDVGFISEQMLCTLHGVNQEEIRQYFPFTKVVEGFGNLMSRLYGVTLREDTSVSVYNPDVRFFEVYDKAGRLRGGFYSDLFARTGKRSGAWMDEMLLRIHVDEGIQIPIAYLNCNFAKPKEGEDSYLTHEEITTFFHEAGHVMHHLLTKTTYGDLSMAQVEWDSVELPSQLSEEWCFEKELLVQMSAHKETGAQIPDALISKLIDAKYFNCGLSSLRQFLLGIFDMELYATSHQSDSAPANMLWHTLCARLDVRPLPEYVRYPNSFQHIFSGGYSAGYYSYMWANALVADVFAAFKESGDVFSQEVGMRYLQEILEVGASRKMSESFRAFRGRDPDPSLLAVHLGIKTTP